MRVILILELMMLGAVLALVLEAALGVVLVLGGLALPVWMGVKVWSFVRGSVRRVGCRNPQ